LHAEFGDGDGDGDGDGGGASAVATKPQPALLPSGGAPRVRPALPRLAPQPQPQQQQRPASAARQQRRGSVPIRPQVPPRMELSSSAERDLLARSDRPWLHPPRSQPSRSPMLAKARAVPSRASARGGAPLGASASAPALNLRAAPPAGGGVRRQKAAHAPAVSAAVAPATALPHREQALDNEALLVTGLPVPRGLDDLSERVTNQQLELYRQQQHELGLAGDAGREYLQ